MVWASGGDFFFLDKESISNLTKIFFFFFFFFFLCVWGGGGGEVE